MADEITPGKVLLAEYEQLKAEQRARIRVRDGLLYTTLAAMAAAVVGAIQARSNGLLLVLPPVVVVLGWTYLVNDEKVQHVGRYLRDVLIPQMTAVLSSQVSVFGWETAHRVDSGRQLRKIGWLVADVLVFCAAPLVALVAFWVTGPWSPVLIVASVVDGLLVMALTAVVITHADVAAGS
jgi:hypothetical protein